jgi:hypothetical protein
MISFSPARLSRRNGWAPTLGHCWQCDERDRTGLEKKVRAREPIKGVFIEKTGWVDYSPFLPSGMERKMMQISTASYPSAGRSFLP